MMNQIALPVEPSQPIRKVIVMQVLYRSLSRSTDEINNSTHDMDDARLGRHWRLNVLTAELLLPALSVFQTIRQRFDGAKQLNILPSGSIEDLLRPIRILRLTVWLGTCPTDKPRRDDWQRAR